MSSYGLGIVLICALSGLVLSLVIVFVVEDANWRRVIFSVGLAAAVFYVAIQDRGYDEWDAYAAVWYSGGAVIGWLAGFGVGATRGRILP
jgi:hypothetical protein